jgi:hypothetical protein
MSPKNCALAVRLSSTNGNLLAFFPGSNWFADLGVRISVTIYAAGAPLQKAVQTIEE